MNSPSEMLQIIHEAVGSIPEQVANTLGQFSQPELPGLPELNLQGLGPSEIHALPMASQSGSDYPEFPDTSGAFPDFPAFAAPELPETSFPTIEGSDFAGDSAAFPSLPGFSATASSVPSADDSDSDLAQTLREIRDGLKDTGADKRSPGFQRSGGPVRIGGAAYSVMDPDADEDFAQSSPSVNAGSTAGLRGAGGYGYGSRYGDSSSLSGGKTNRNDFLERK